MSKFSNNSNKKPQQWATIPKHLQLPAEVVNSVTSSLRLVFINADEPPADQVIVYPQLVQKDEELPGYVNATVRIVKDWCGLKSHKVNIRVKLNNKNNCLPDTLSFI